MDIYNSINDKKDEFTQTETEQIKPKNNSEEKKFEIFQQVNEINIEYKGKDIDSIIRENNELKEVIKDLRLILNNCAKLENEKKENISNEKDTASIQNIKSKYILKRIFSKLNKNKMLGIIKYNKHLQGLLNLDKNDYEEHFKIEIELIPTTNKFGRFINILKKEDKTHFHIYFDDNEEEIKRYYLNKKDNISKIKIIIDYQIKSLAKLFLDCQCIKSITFKKFNRKNIISMENMFNNCTSLEEINFSNFNTEDVKNMNYMFFDCKSLKELNLSKFDTKNVLRMYNMFHGCSSLIKLNLSNFNTINVNDMSFMFDGCSSLETINLSNFKTNKLENMNGMFFGCSSLKEIDLSNFYTKNVYNMDYIFEGCSSLKKINLSNFNTDNVISMINIFSNCSSLKEIDISNFNTENVTDMSGMFSGCRSLKKINLLNFKTKNLARANKMFYGCYSLEDINFSNFDLNEIIEMKNMFCGCSYEMVQKLKNDYNIKREEAFD